MESDPIEGYPRIGELTRRRSSRRIHDL